MHIRLLSGAILSSLLVAHARSLDLQPQLRYPPRDRPFTNSTITTRPTSSPATQLNIITTSPIIPATTSATSLNTDQFTNWEIPTGLISISTSSPLRRPPFQNTSTTSTTTTTEPTCIGFATYFESVPPTVFLTVTEGFDVTVTAANESVTVPETLITPLPACDMTIMPAKMSVEGNPVGAPAAATPTMPFNDSQPGAPRPGTQYAPNFGSFRPGLQPQESTSVTEMLKTETAPVQYSSVAYTSTVIVTKKTPVTVVVPPTSTPGVNFQPTEPTFGLENTKPPPPKGTGPTGNINMLPPGGTTTSSQTSPPSTGPTTSRPNVGFADLIVSLILSGIARPTRDPAPGTTVNGVPIVVLPSTVVIGDQSFALPTSARTSVQVNGVGFELGPSEIVAPSTTIAIRPGSQQQMTTITPRPTATTVTVGDGLTLTVGQTVAVIAGTTYRVGPGAPATTITVDGATVSVGSNGVGLPRTVVSPAGASASGYVVYTVHGITFSVDDNEAVLSSTTYRIGSNAPQMTTVVGGETISFGPSGIGLESTTIHPTAVPSASATTGARSTASGSATGGGAASSENAAPSQSRITFSELLGWYLIPTTCLVWNYLV